MRELTSASKLYKHIARDKVEHEPRKKFKPPKGQKGQNNNSLEQGLRPRFSRRPERAIWWPRRRIEIMPQVESRTVEGSCQPSTGSALPECGSALHR